MVIGGDQGFDTSGLLPLFNGIFMAQFLPFPSCSSFELFCCSCELDQLTEKEEQWKRLEVALVHGKLYELTGWCVSLPAPCCAAELRIIARLSCGATTAERELVNSGRDQSHQFCVKDVSAAERRFEIATASVLWSFP